MSVNQGHIAENYPPGGELRLMLLGKTGSGKSCLGNALLGDGGSSRGFASAPPGSLQSHTDRCQQIERLTRGRFLLVVDTPGTMDTCQPDDALRQLSQAITMFADGGVHAFLITLRLDVRFTAEEEAAVDMLSRLFGKRFYDFAVIAFTHGDAHDNDEARFFTAIQAARTSIKSLGRLIRLCSDRFVMLDNGQRCDKARQADQVMRLVCVVDELVRSNAARLSEPVYTNEYFALAQRELQAETDSAKREYEEKLRQAMEQERENVRRNFQARREAAIEKVADIVVKRIQADGNSCFPADAVVQTPSGPVMMSQLSVGQSVLCTQNGKLIYSPVYMWGHRDEASCSNSYVTVRTESAQLTLSSDHLLFIIDEMGDEVSVPAGDVCAGHTVQVLHHLMPDGLKCEKVVTVERCVMRCGLFAPFTICGNIIVDGVLASCYIRCMSPALSHALLWPVRFAWQLAPSAVEACNRLGDDGMPSWISVIASRILPGLGCDAVGDGGKDCK